MRRPIRFAPRPPIVRPKPWMVTKAPPPPVRRPCGFCNRVRKALGMKPL